MRDNWERGGGEGAALWADRKRERERERRKREGALWRLINHHH